MKHLTFVLLTLVAIVASSPAQVRVLPEGKRPDDARLGELHHLDGYFPFRNVDTPAEWEKRRAKVKRQTLVAMGLWPLPERTPLNAVIHGRITRDDYIVERVYFESFPGFYVTGSLYRPRDNRGKKLAGVISPHGHWNNGRFHDAGEGAAKTEIESGAEEAMEAARAPLQARAVHLARLGCAVFLYDMVGYADCTQISRELAHGFRTQRPEMNTEENWGLFSPRAVSHLQGIMGLQAWNAIRALDFISTLPEVDTARLGVTGASGGGTQTIVTGIVDDRPAALVPAVMTSTAMQGGCTCENASLLRVNTGNVEFAALAAPRPQGMNRVAAPARTRRCCV
jgi:dienelactone hydrolase